MSQSLRVDNQIVAYASGGRPFDPAKPVLVLLHGAGMDHTVWALQTRFFAHHGHSVLALDLPAHGGSGGTAFETIGAYAGWLERLFDAAGIEKAALVGHSLGALIALDFTAGHPSRLRTLTLLGAGAKMPVHPDMLASAQAGTDEVLDCMTSWGHARRHHFGGHRAPGLWMLGSTRHLVARARPGVIHAGLKACHTYADALAAAAKVTCPTTLILGAEDMMTPAKSGLELGRAIAGARIEIIPGCGHMMMQEAPDQTLDRMRGNA
ncbi:MAG: alpha/beta hydrolase [Rhodospirillales bacterium]|nr:alpha/beta hydrolase [Rhodospirillales bacterium]